MDSIKVKLVLKSRHKFALPIFSNFKISSQNMFIIKINYNYVIQLILNDIFRYTNTVMQYFS